MTTVGLATGLRGRVHKAPDVDVTSLAEHVAGERVMVPGGWTVQVVNEHGHVVVSDVNRGTQPEALAAVCALLRWTAAYR